MMRIVIHSFALENFASFLESTWIDFTVGVKAGQRKVFLDSCIPNQAVNAVTGIFGPNASGKTNLLKALAFLRYFLLQSAASAPHDDIPIESFAFVSAEHQDIQPIRLRLDFEFEQQCYRYELVLTRDRVRTESLHRKEQRWRYLFDRQWNTAKEQYDFKFQDIGPSKQIALRKNASFLSAALLQEHPFAEKIAEFFNSWYVNVYAYGRAPTHEPHAQNVLQATEFFKSQPEWFQLAESHLLGADLGIAQLEIREGYLQLPDGQEEKIPLPFVKHQSAGISYWWPLVRESRGTQALFILLRYLLPVLQRGGIAIIDEFETGLHSHLVKSLVELFYSRELNPKRAQLIANFHTDYLLQDVLEKYQIIITEKNPETLSTEAWRLDEVKGERGIRNANNHYAKYHAGVYGGIPRL